MMDVISIDNMYEEDGIANLCGLLTNLNLPNTVYEQFWSGGDEFQNLQRADAIIRGPFCGEGGNCGKLTGYGSGGTIAVPR